MTKPLPMYRRLALISLVVLSGCASLSKEDCLTGNWDEIGFRDGTNGRTSAYIQEHAKACEKVGVVPQASVWEQGRQRGLPAYCVPSKAYSEGRSGRSLSAVCPADQIPALRAANEKGRTYFNLSNKINDAERRIYEIELELVGEEQPSTRAFLVQSIRSLRAEIQMLETRRRLVDTL